MKSFKDTKSPRMVFLMTVLIDQRRCDWWTLDRGPLPLALTVEFCLLNVTIKTTFPAWKGANGVHEIDDDCWVEE